MIGILPWRLILAGLLAAAVLVGVPILWHRHNTAQQAIGYERRAAEDKAAAEAQTARNRDNFRQSELRYTAAAELRDRFIVTTVREIRDAAAPLADCRLPEPVRLRLGAAAECARGDSPGTDCAGQPVPDTR